MRQSLSPRQAFAAFLLGTLLVQAAWILVLPTFGGSDEFDHAYRAAQVAHGELAPGPEAKHGRGALVVVPGDIVKAASSVCAELLYTGHDNCFAVEKMGHGLVTVASAAANYNPVYYAIVGTAARPFHGDGADYAMRATTAIICALLIAWAASLVASWSDRRWSLLALSIALTPVLLYSTSIAAPNGVGYAAGVLVWAAALGLTRPLNRIHPNANLTALSVGAVAMVNTHTTGPMWLALIFFVVLLLKPVRFWLQRARDQQLAHLSAAVVIGVATVGALLWTHFSGANAPGPALSGLSPLRPGMVASSELVWVFQAIGAFPLRSNSAPVATYVLWLGSAATCLWMTLRSVGPRVRAALAALVALVVVVPGTITVLTYSFAPLEWQGRYALPLTVGLMMIPARVAAKSTTDAGNHTIGLVGGAIGLATALSLGHVYQLAAAVGAGRSVAEAFPGGLGLVIVLAVAGVLLPPLTLLRASRVRASVPAQFAEGLA
ncbi:MAG: hypothetical protein JWR35_2673 [Marmoricola sp.]|nr:hypothetical protein [Marmoricola sp.]